jgi:hypothetical protein
MMSPNRSRTPILAVAAIALGLAVVGGILLIGGVGVPAATPSPTVAPTAAPTPTAAPSATDPLSNPEGAVRAFFAALKEARKTSDAAAIRPYVTDEASSAYLSVQGFVDGQKAANKASVLTVQQLDSIQVQLSGETATVQLIYTEGGYDISLDTGEPLESPGTLAPRDVTIELRQVDGRWLVDSYEAQAP